MNQKRIHYAWWIMVSCCAIMFTGLGVLVNSVGIFFVPICDELGFSRAAISFYVTIMNIAMVIALPFAGKIFPRFNIKWILGLALGISAFSFAAMSQFHSLISWYINGAVRGVCNAFIMYMPVPLLINNWFHKKAGLAMGIAMACSGIGGAIGNPLGNYIILNYGWRMGYAVLGFICAAVSLPIIFALVRFKPEDMGLKPYGYEEGATDTGEESSSAKTGVTANKALRTSSFYFIFFFAGLVSLAAYLSPQLPGYAASLGYSSSVGAYTVSVVMIGVIIGKIGLGILNDKFGITRATLTGCFFGALGMLLLIVGKSNLLIFYSGAFIFGFGFALATVIPPLIVKHLFGMKDYSAIFSYVTVGTALLGGFATFIFGYIFDVTKSFYYAIILCLLAYIVSGIFVALGVKTGSRIKS